jgi:uncharacterized protein YjdB
VQLCRSAPVAIEVVATLSLAILAACGDAVSATRPDVATVVIDPATNTLSPGGSTRLEATVRDAAGNVLAGRDVFWASQNATIASISAEGVVTAKAPGTVQVAASSEGKSGLARVIVVRRLARITIAPEHSELIPGERVTLVAEGRDAGGVLLPSIAIEWSSSDDAVATVSATGVVTAVAPGTAVVSASSDGITGLATVVVHPAPVASITVTPSSLSLGVGEAAQLTAVVRDANGVELEDRIVSWTTTDDGVALVSSTGLVLARARGSAVVTATSEGKTATVPVSVHDVAVASVVILPDRAVIGLGGSVQLVGVPRDAAGNPLPGRAITWKSDKPAIATVSTSGLVIGVGAGVATITATSEGKSATAQVTVQGVPVARVEVSPASVTMDVGATRQLTAKVFDASGNVLTGRTVTWSSGNTFIATVYANGLVRAVKRGQVTITATSEGKSGSASVTVR